MCVTFAKIVVWVCVCVDECEVCYDRLLQKTVKISVMRVILPNIDC